MPSGSIKDTLWETGVIVLFSSIFPIEKGAFLFFKVHIFGNFPLCLTEHGVRFRFHYFHYFAMFPQQKPNHSGHKVNENVLLKHTGASQKIAGIC